MLDIRAVAYIAPASEVDFASVTLTARLVNYADEAGFITARFRVYNSTTGTLIHSSEILPVSLPAGQFVDVTALTAFDPPAPLDDTYFVVFDGHASNSLVPDGIGFFLGAFHFDVKPVGMGPAPAAHHATHEESGSDPIDAGDLGTTEMDDALVLSPDGAGGVEWSSIPTAKGATSEASSATPTPDADLYCQYALTALAEAADFQNPTGTLADGQKLIIRILDDGNPWALTWGAAYADRGAALPATTVAGKIHYIGLLYNNDQGTWDCVAATVEA